MAEEGEIAAAETPRRRFHRTRRVGKWTAGLIAAIVLLIVAAAVVLNTPIGQRALTERIAAQTLPNGLNIRIGRIEGDLYGKAVLRDVRLYDLRGLFATIPRAEVDWRPTAWLSNRLDIRGFAARRATLLRVPSFRPGDPAKPYLPSFDISIDRLQIDNLTLAAGIAGPRAQRVDLDGAVQVTDRRLKIDSRGRFGRTDSYAFRIDAEPDGNDFDLALDYRAAADGPVAQMLGADAAWRAQVGGDGTWQNWNGFAVVRRDGERFAAFRLTNRAGLFGLLGRAYPGEMLTGTLAGLAGEAVSVDAAARIGNRRIDGRYAVSSRALRLDARGLVDLAQNRAENLAVNARLRAPLVLGGVRLENTDLTATADGAFTDLALDHTLRVGRLVSGTTVLTGLVQRGTATREGTVWTLPLDASVARVVTGTAMLDPRLVRGRANGTLRLAGTRLGSDRLRIVFPNTRGDFALAGDLARGVYRLDGTASARQLVLENVGRASGSAKFTLDIGGRTRGRSPRACRRGSPRSAMRRSPISPATASGCAAGSIWAPIARSPSTGWWSMARGSTWSSMAASRVGGPRSRAAGGKRTTDRSRSRRRSRMPGRAPCWSSPTPIRRRGSRTCGSRSSRRPRASVSPPADNRRLGRSRARSAWSCRAAARRASRSSGCASRTPM